MPSFVARDVPLLIASASFLMTFKTKYGLSNHTEEGELEGENAEPTVVSINCLIG